MKAEKALESFFKGIVDKNIDAIKSVLPSSGPVTAVMCDGTILEHSDDIVEFHEEWFSDGQWSMSHDLAIVDETAEMAYAVAECEYFDKDEDGESYSMTMLCSCVMRKVDEKWTLSLYQQTEALSEED